MYFEIFTNSHDAHEITSIIKIWRDDASRHDDWFGAYESHKILCDSIFFSSF